MTDTSLIERYKADLAALEAEQQTLLRDGKGTLALLNQQLQEIQQQIAATTQEINGKLNEIEGAKKYIQKQLDASAPDDV